MSAGVVVDKRRGVVVGGEREEGGGGATGDRRTGEQVELNTSQAALSFASHAVCARPLLDLLEVLARDDLAGNDVEDGLAGGEVRFGEGADRRLGDLLGLGAGGEQWRG
jgi:hypothetical protein